MKENEGFAPYLCESWNSISYFCISYAAVLRIVVDTVAQTHPDIYCAARIPAHLDSKEMPLASVLPEVAQNCKIISTNPTFIWGDALDIHFVPQEGFTQLKINNEEERRVATFFNAVTQGLVDYLIDVVFAGDRIKFTESPFEFLYVLAKRIKPASELNKSLRTVSVTLRKQTLNILNEYEPKVGAQGDLKTLSFEKLNFRHGAKNTQVVHRTCRRLFTLFLAHVEEWFKRTYKTDGFFYPSLPGVRIYQPALQMGLTSALAYLKDSQSDHTGFFSIVREARGSVTNRDHDMNLLVRDLLWIRPREVDEASFVLDETIHQLPHQEKNGAEDHGSRIGYYYSAIDGLVYEVKRVVVRSNIMMIDALAILEKDKVSNADRPPKSMCLYLPLIDNEDLDFTMGTLMGGTATNTRTGGWSVVAIRPPLESMDYGVESLLEKKFCIYADSLARTKRNSYDKLIKVFAKFIEQTGLVGILYARSFEQSVQDETLKKSSREAASSFRSLFRVMPDYRKNCQKLLDEIEARVFDGGEPDRAMFRSVTMDLIEQQNSYAIAPLTVYKSALDDYDEEGTKRAVEVLSRLGVTIPSYREYEDIVAGS